MESTLSARRRPVTVLAALSALPLLIALLDLQMDLIFSVDDFCYAAYWRDGLSGFLELNARHYSEMNGRTLIHMAAQTVLAFGSEEFCGVMGLVFLCAALYLAWRALGAAEHTAPLAFALPAAALLLLLTPETLRETLLWTSAYYNYAFPMVLLMGQFWALSRWLEKGGWRLGLACALCSALAGATTELYGAMAIAGAVCLALVRLCRTREGWARAVLSPVCALAGLATVLFSPATQLRMSQEMELPAGAAQTGGERYLERLEQMAGTLFGPEGSGAVFLTALFALAFLLGLLRRDRRPLAVWGGAAALLWLIPDTVDRFWFALAATAALAVTLLALRGLEGAGALLCAGGAAALAVCMTGSVAPRTMFPFLLAVALAAGALWAESLAELDRRAAAGAVQWALPAAWGIALVLTAAGVLAAFAPTGRAVTANAALDRANRSAAREAVRTGEPCWYNVDYDRRYCHTGIYEFSAALAGYLDYWGLTRDRVWFTSDTVPYVTVEGERIRTLAGSPPGEDGSPGQLPVADVMAALGGEARWEDGALVLELDGRTCRWKRSRYRFTDKWGYPVEYVAYAEKSGAFTFLAPEVLDIVFGIKTEYNAAENCYDLTYEPELGAGAGYPVEPS